MQVQVLQLVSPAAPLSPVGVLVRVLLLRVFVLRV
jgi:hypothetical protein